MTPKAAIIGGAGPTGQILAALLVSAGWQVRVLDIAAPEKPLCIDATDEAQLSGALRSWGDLDALICLTRAPCPAALAATSWPDWQRVMAVHGTAALLSMRCARLRPGGAVVLRTRAVRAGTSACVAAADGAVLGLARAASGGFAPMQVRVNAVVEQDGTLAASSAAAMAWLASGRASFVTGAELHINSRAIFP